MTSLFKKLNYKEEASILILNAPKSMEVELKEMAAITKIDKSIKSAKKIGFAMIFVTKQSEIDQSIEQIYSKMELDATIWYCYPKASSKKYKCDFNRDNGWQSLGKYNLEGVRMVAIDEDWSALRFRKIDYIKNFTRSETMALSTVGKNRTTNQRPEIIVPTELKSRIDKNSKLSAAWAKLAYTCRKEYAQYISEAKKEETKVRRLEKILPMILAGKNFS